MNFTIFIIGHSGVGKSTFIHNQGVWVFERDNDGTYTVQIQIGRGPVVLNVKIFEEYSNKPHDAEIIMYDVTCANTLNILKNIPESHIPRVIAANKSDLGVKVTSQYMEYPYYEISAKTRRLINKPIWYLLKELVGTQH